MHTALSQLLFSRDTTILPLALVSLTSLASEPKYADQIVTSDTVRVWVWVGCIM